MRQLDSVEALLRKVAAPRYDRTRDTHDASSRPTLCNSSLGTLQPNSKHWFTTSFLWRNFSAGKRCSECDCRRHFPLQGYLQSAHLATVSDPPPPPPPPHTHTPPHGHSVFYQLRHALSDVAHYAQLTDG